MFDLRTYQDRIVSDARRAIGEGHRRILIVLPTGGGKGIVSAAMMEMAAEKQNKSVFFAAQRELINQIAAHLDGQEIANEIMMAGVKNEYMSADDFDQARYCKLVAKDTLWSRRKNIEFPEARVVQIDEAHGSLAMTWQKIMEFYAKSIIIGWTATPCRTDGRPLGEYYSTMVMGPTYKELQAGGWLVPVKCYAPYRPDLKGLKVSGGDYQKGQLEERMNRAQMVGDIYDEWNKSSDGRSTIVYAAGIQHSLHIRETFRAAGVDCEHIDGKTPRTEREDILGRARDGFLPVVTNYSVLTTGVDVPIWKYMICARPTKSFALWRQMGGRIQRPWGDYDHCFIQDHSDNGINFGYPDEDVDWQLDGNEKIEVLHRKKKADDEGSEPREAVERTCRECLTKFTGAACTQCGWRWEPPPEAIKMKAEELRELERRKLNRDTSQLDKQKYWDHCFGVAIQANQSMKAVCGMYAERFGVYPNHEIQEVPRGRHEWRMSAKTFWFEVVKPARQAERDKSQTVMF